MRVVGIHAVTQALRAGSGTRLIVRPGDVSGRLQAVMDLAESLACVVVRDEINQDEVAHQGVALEVKPPSFQSEKSLLDSLIGTDLLLVLDGVTDPRNFGACLRSAASFGVTGVVVPRDRSAPLNEAAVKTASGAASLVPVYRVTNLGRCLDQVKKAGVWVVGTALEGASDLNTLDLQGSLALVMGAEGTGLRQKTREKCDFLARIPMPYPDLSLNVSVATGICLYEAHRQRNQPG